MPDEHNRIDEGYFDGSLATRRFHLGKHPQGGIPPDLTEAEIASVEAHRAQIHAPESRPRFLDDDGNELVVGVKGLVFDEETGTVTPLVEEAEAAPAAATSSTSTKASTSSTSSTSGSTA